MTDKPSTTYQPSMEDILASIRRIISDDDKKIEKPVPAEAVAETPRESASFAVDDDAAALARAEYDAAMGREARDISSPDVEEETIFPQRGGALWRRVAGHPLSEGETDPLPADDTLELTEVLEDGALGLDEKSGADLDVLLGSTDATTPAETDRVLEDMLANTGNQSDATASPDSGDDSIGIGAVTAAGLGAAGAVGATVSTLGRASETNKHAGGEADDVLNLSRGVETPDSVEKWASSLEDSSSAGAEADDLPPMEFERVDVEPFDGSQTGTQEGELDRSFETAAVTGVPDDIAASVSGVGGDERERALDERFYEPDEFADMPPEISGTYSASRESEGERSRHEGAPTEDEMETVGGLVRDALRSRMPAGPQPHSDPDPLVSGGAEESAARSLASLAQYDSHAPRRIYGGIKITDDEDSPTIEGVVQDTLRPMLREWLNDNLPTLVENMVKQEVERISARSRQFVRDDD